MGSSLTGRGVISLILGENEDWAPAYVGVTVCCNRANQIANAIMSHLPY
jgi:hypothetical protein